MVDPSSRAGRSVDALVADAAERQALVAVRELGRSGLAVGAVGSDADAPAFGSRYCVAAAITPAFESDREAYLNALLEACAELRPRIIMPVHDGSIEALRTRRSELERFSALALAPEDALAAATDKERTYAAAERVGLQLPRGVTVRTAAEARAAVEELGLPVVVKPVQSWVSTGGSGRRVRGIAATDRADAIAAAESVLAGGTDVLVQEWLEGAREALSFIYSKGRFWARFAQRAMRMLPPLGGNSIMRESIPLPDDITAPAEELVEALGLEGYTEVEFRRDRHGRAALMEINPRLSASVEVAVRSGVSFPRLLYAWAAGEQLTEVPGYRLGVRMRWLGGDLSWLRASFNQAGEPDVPSRIGAAATVLGGFSSRTGYDYIDRRDLVPALRAVQGGARRWRRRVVAARSVPRVAGSRPDTEVAVIGAGPYGLSLSAHLSAQNTSHEIFGVPMDTWRSHMPSGMLLKSEGFASNLSAPTGDHTLERFCAETGREYGRIAVPIELEKYVAYGSWFQERVVPRLDRRLVRRVSRSRGGFELELDGGDELSVRQLVVATGVQSQSYLPEALRGLPPELVTHSFDHSDPADAPDSGVIVIGSGQSAIEGATLIRERGRPVRLLARASSLKWNGRPGGRDRSLRQRWRYPESGLGEGRPQWASANFPLVYHAAPREWRFKTAFEVLGPAGAWWLRSRFEGQVEPLLERRVMAASHEQGAVTLRCETPQGDETLTAGRLIAGTGFRPAVDRLEFIDGSLRAEVKTVGGAPALDRSFECSVPGLFFVGYLAAPSFGPVMRFVFGADFAVRRVARRCRATR
jgi:cation diffusion facilitator CzcD-associated flavoprotein CzcO/predicted ATP-grasp superfamily ATP-dependent carboligase